MDLVSVEGCRRKSEALWQPGAKPEEAKVREYQAFYDALRSIAPCSELEGMLAVHMIAVQNGAMECMRRVADMID